jgi:transcriptional regulator with GAF, ATPase, and Fis domain
VDELVIKGTRDRSIVREDPDGRTVLAKLEDKRISRPHAKVRRVIGGWELEDLHSTNGTRVNGDLVGRTTLFDGSVIAVGRSLLIFRDLGAGSTATLCRGARLGAPEASSSRPVIFPTLVHDLERALFEVAAVTASPLSVLVRGETGTGKEVVAQAIHNLSGRRGRFIPINCGALARGLIESSLFGHRRGAFSGANEDRPGFVRSADHGTLFLDEIGDLPLAAQVAFLRVLQEHEVIPVGASHPVPVDIRVIAATHRDLRAMVERGTFRQDLYARLVGCELVLPPLRERREDIGILMGALLQKLGQTLGVDVSTVTFDREAAQALLMHDYPHNVRELEKALEVAVAQTRGGAIKLEHLPETIRDYAAKGVSPEQLRRRERLITVLRETHGNVSEAARIMGTKPVQIRRWCRSFGINAANFRDLVPNASR